MTVFISLHRISYCRVDEIGRHVPPEAKLVFTDNKGNSIDLFMDMRLAEALKDAWDEFHNQEPEPLDPEILAQRADRLHRQLKDAGR